MGLLLLAALLGGCHLFRKAPSPPPPPEAFPIGSLANLSLPPGWYAFRGMARYKGRQNIASPFSMRLKADSVIWISYAPALGVEVLRVRITRDAGEVLNRLERRHYRQRRETLGAGIFPSSLLDLNTFQHVIWGIPRIASVKAYQWSQGDSVIVGRQQHPDYREELVIDPSYRRLRQWTIKDEHGQTLAMEYGPYQAADDTVLYPTWIKIRVYPRGKDTPSDTILIRFKKVHHADVLNVPFTIPPGYEEGP